MKNSGEINKEIQALQARVEAIMAIAKDESRDLSQEETTEIDSIVGTSDQPGKIASLNASKERQLRVEATASTIMRGMEERESGDDSGELVNRIRIPAKAKVHGPLRSYIGNNAEKEAYIAGNVILAGVFGNNRASQVCRDLGLQVSASMTSSDNSKGGFLVPDEMQRALIRLREQRGVFPQFANRVPMASDIITIPRLLSDVTAYWVGETAEITASDASLGAAELMARKLGALTKVSSELDEDSVIDIGDMITQSIAYAMADKIDEAGFNGDGTSTYGGVLGLKNALSSSATSTAATGNDAASNLDLVDFEAAVGMYPEYPGASPRWFMHKAFYYASAARLMDAAGGNTNITLSNGASETLFLGYPVTFCQVLHSTTTTSASTVYGYFGDLRLGVSYGTRRSMRTEVLTERYAENDLIGIKVTERIGINVHERGDTIRNRPIIMLKTAA